MLRPLGHRWVTAGQNQIFPVDEPSFSLKELLRRLRKAMRKHWDRMCFCRSALRVMNVPTPGIHHTWKRRTEVRLIIMALLL